MLFKRPVLEQIVRGEVTLAFRRWRRPAVRCGSRLRTALGILEVRAVSRVDAKEISTTDARRAGAEDRAAMMNMLDGHDGDIYRIELRYVGEDPRVSLRSDIAIDEQGLVRLRDRLDRLDRRGGRDAWTRRTLELIATRAGVRAADLALRLGRDVVSFKRDVRELKELGLVESLSAGYRLSPRGCAFLALDR